MPKPLQKLLIFVGFIIVFIADEQSLFAQFADQKEKSKWRMGLGRNIYTISYGYETLRSSGGSSYNTKVTSINAGMVHTTSLVTEYILSPGFGLEVDLGISPGQRNFTLEATGSYNGKTTKIGDVTESLSMNYLYGGNFFFTNSLKQGFNMSLGVLTGSFSVKHEFTDGGARDDGETDSWTNFKKTQNSNLNFQVAIIKVSFEYILKSSGFRLEYLSSQHDVKDSSNLSTTGNNQTQYESVIFSGGVGLVVFARF